MYMTVSATLKANQAFEVKKNLSHPEFMQKKKQIIVNII